MAFNPFIGMSEATLETHLATLQKQYVSLLSSTSAGDVSQSRVTEMAQIEARIEKILRRLHELNPTDYPAASVTRMTTFKAGFPSI